MDRLTWVRQELPTLIARAKAGLGPTYTCFEHGTTYTSEQLMCPHCEREICETNDGGGE